MRYFVIAIVLALSACTTVVPVKQKFPEAPEVLMEKCPQLKTVNEDNGTLREFLKTVIENYATYYQCAGKTQGWQEWYKEQKNIFENVK